MLKLFFKIKGGNKRWMRPVLSLILAFMTIIQMTPILALADSEPNVATIETSSDSNIIDESYNPEGSAVTDGPAAVFNDEAVTNDAVFASDAAGLPIISLIWDISASKFNSDDMTVNEDSTAIDVSLISNTTQTATLQLHFSMNSAPTAEPGEIEIRIPMNIFTDRTGVHTGGYKLNLQENVQQGSTGFYYTIEDNEIVIRNFNEIGGGETFLCQIDYTFIPSNVADGYSNTDITAAYTLCGGEPVLSNPLEIQVHTRVMPPRSFTKTAVKYESWQDSWGSNPDPDSLDYYYLVWAVTFYSDGPTSTQPYDVILLDEQTDGVIIGSGASSSDAFVEGNTATFKPSVTSSQSTNRYFLMKYPRSKITEGHEVVNKVTASLFGVDNTGDDANHTVEATGNYTYSMLAFEYEGDGYNLSKTKASSFSSSGASPAIGMAGKLLEGSDDNMVSVKLTGGTSYPYSYYLSVDARGYGLTLIEGGNPDVPEDFGQKAYTTELIDDLLFLKNQRLNAEDYSISSCYITLNEYEFLRNDNSGGYEEKLSTDYSAYNDVKLFYQIAGGSAWIDGGSITRTGYHAYNYDDGKGEVQTGVGSGGQIELPGGVTGLKFVHEGNKYRVSMNAYITVTLNSTEHVREILQSQNSVDLYNICTMLVKDSDGFIRNSAAESTVIGAEDVRKAVIEHDKSLYGNIVHHGTDYIRLSSFTPRTNIAKTYSTFTDNGSEQTILYTINIYEYCYYGSGNISSDGLKTMGIVKEQTEGTFYDLLPKGTSADNISVKTYNGSQAGNICEITFRIVADWQGSGRTMLIVSAKAPETTPNYYETSTPSSGYNTLYSGFSLTYRLTNSYFNIVDNGVSATNLVAYRSATGQLSDGTTAGSQSKADFKYFQKLESDEIDDNNNDTVYAYHDYNFTKPTAALYGIFKQVRAAGGYSFGAEADVFPTGQYIYQLRYENSSTGGKATNLIMYDVLEELGYWRGALESIDTSSAEAKGINPVVYYSTVSGLNPLGKNEHADLNNTAVWSVVRPQSGVTAIAIDLRLKHDGSPYEISSSETVFCLVNMIAPDNYRDLLGKLAVNKVSYSLDYALGGIITKTDGLSKETKVALRGPELEIEKSSDPANSVDMAYPTLVGRNETLEYTVTVKNNEGVVIRDIEVVDTIPNELTIDIGGLKYYFGTDPDSAATIAGSGIVSVERNGQKLVFTVKELLAGGKISFIIPTTVNSDAADGDNIINISYITKINDKEYTIKSNKTRHQVDPVLSLHANKKLTGRKLVENEFSFEVKDATGATVAVATNNAGGSITFSEIVYKNTGEYHYVVSEVSGALKNVTYDKTVFEVTVVVKRDENGQLVAAAIYPEGGIVFNNTYKRPDDGGPPPPSGEKEDPKKPPVDPPKVDPPEIEGPDEEDPPVDETEKPPIGESEPPPGGKDGNDKPPAPVTPPAVPPTPNKPERPLVPNGPDSYIEYDSDGTPLGEWRWDGTEWIFDEYPPLGGLPRTGGWGFPEGMALLLGCTLLGIGTGATKKFITKKHGIYEK